MTCMLWTHGKPSPDIFWSGAVQCGVSSNPSPVFLVSTAVLPGIDGGISRQC